MKVPDKLLSFLRKEDKFFIATHINPEGDAIGSAIALSMALETLGKNTFVYNRDTVPELYRFLPGHERFNNSITPLVTDQWSLILLDCNTLERAGIKGVKFKCSVVIDHHETEKDFGDIKWIEPNAAATGLMLFHLIKELGVKITEAIATNLYSAISIDTATFRYSSTTAEVLRVGAELLEAGASASFISNCLYETWSKERFALLIMSLNTLEIKGNVAITTVTKEMYRKTGAGSQDTENFSSFPRMIKEIKVSALFKELGDNYWKVSLRSKGDVNVARIATVFDGGGHKDAAGYKIKADLESAKESLLRVIHETSFNI